MISCSVISNTYGVDVHLLRTFVTVASLASFSAAAAQLGYTQAAVSQQIAALENDLKVPLLTRRPVAPTEAGARLLEHAEPLLIRLDAARADVTRLTSAPVGTLTIGVTPLAGTTPAFVAALAELRQRMPRLNLTVQSGTRQQIASAVARGALDIALLDGLVAPGDSLPELAPLTAIGITETPVAVVLPPDHPLATRQTLRLSDLADARWIEAPDVAPPLAEIRRLSGAEGFHQTLHYDGTDTNSLVALATAGHGLTLLPATALTASVTSVAVTTPRLAHRVELLHGSLRKDSPPAVLAALLS
jgi:DNA-binding transcriptional LysR family regulator